jgi:pimeloyl-ACP methyl ester carboxylesterase
MRTTSGWFWGLFCFVLNCPCPAAAQEVGSARATSDRSVLFNLPTKTLGGQQFWSDVYFDGGWHIQKNAVSHHYRLLDPGNTRQAWGTFEQCTAILDAKRHAGEVQPYQGRVVILLHGLNRTHTSMNLMADKLRTEQGFQTINFQYASSRRTVQDHADALAGVIDGLGPDVTEIHFVAHSLGNLVVRNYLHQRQNLAAGHAPDLRLSRMVMLGPPNQGSQLARLLKGNLAFHAIAGGSGQQLSRHWAELANELAVPAFPFAIVAGGGESENVYERVVFEGPSDWVVAVAETSLPGAALHMQLPVTHTFMMEDPRIINITANFLNDKIDETQDVTRPTPDARPRTNPAVSGSN